MSFSKLTIGALMAVVTASACEVPPQQSQNPQGNNPAVQSDALFRRLGGDGGIRTIMADFVTRVAGDPRINGYFLNNNVSATRVQECLVVQVSAATGGPFQYPSLGCRDMRSVHANMKISQNDFNDTLGHLVGALTTRGVSTADIATIAGVINGMVNDIVEDRGNNATVYQRAGRKPGIENVVVAFMQDLYYDQQINGFFAGGNADRLKTCLTRLVCSIDGPCRYGSEVNVGEPGVTQANPCKDMVTIHKDINRPRTITRQDFDALVGVLVRVLDRTGLAVADKAAIVGALGPMCKDIVKGGVGC
jgi:hemoglobin